MSNEITVDKEFFEHLLNCMAKQKDVHPNSQGRYVGVNEPIQEMIDAAYHKAKALLSQESRELFRRSTETTIYIALALSSGSKAFTTREQGGYIVVERDSSQKEFSCIFIDPLLEHSTSHFHLDEVELFDILREQGIINHHKVWVPVTDAFIEDILR